MERGIQFSIGLGMRILITGGCGFIGSALIRKILDQAQAEVLNLDLLTYAGSRLRLQGYEDRPAYRFEHGDIANRHLVRQSLESYQPDGIIHLAAESHVDRSIDAPADFIHTNILGTFTLLQETLRYLQTKPRKGFRFLHVSTDEVFGSLAPEAFFDEQTPYNPSSPYSASKASADHLVRAWRCTYDFPAIITNCSNNYGPFQFPEKLIPLTIAKCRNEQSIPIYGDGQQVRDWLHVDDHADALWEVFQRGEPGKTYLIGGECTLTNLDVVTKICEIMDALQPRKKGCHRDLIAFVADRPGHDRRYAMRLDRIRRELGWKPRHTFSQGLLDTVRWYLQNAALVDAIVADRYHGERLGRL